MKRAAFGILLAGLAACGGSDSTAPGLAIAGAYTLARVNGQALPAPATLPLIGAAAVTGGSGTVGTDRSVNVTILGTYGYSQTSATLSEAGTVSGGGGNYTFNFSDGTSATAVCTISQCSVAYGANTYVFTRG